MLKKLFIIFLLVGFPLLLADRGIAYFADLKQSNLREAEFQRLDRWLQRYSLYADPEFFLKKALLRIADRAGFQADPQRSLRRVIQRLEKLHPDLFTFTLFDERREVVYSSEPHASRRAPRIVLDILRQGLEAGSDGRLRDRIFEAKESFLTQYLSAASHMGPLRNRSSWFYCSGGPTKSWFFYYLDRRFSLFAHIHRKSLEPLIGIRTLIKKRIPGRTRVNLLDLSKMKRFGSPIAGGDAVLYQLSARYERESTTHFAEQKRLWSVLMVDPSHRLFVSVPDHTEEHARLNLARFRVLAVFLLLVCSFILWQLISAPERKYLSIRWKMHSLFLFSTGVPILILGFVGVAYLEERKINQIHQTWQQDGTILRNFDQNIPLVDRLCEESLQQILHQFPAFAEDQVPLLTERLQSFSDAFRCQNIRLLDRSGRELIASRSSQLSTQEMKFFSGLMSRILRIIRQEPSTLANDRADLEADMILSFTGEHSDNFFDELVRNIGALVRVGFGDSQTVLYLDTLPKGASKPDFLLMVNWRVADIVTLYLDRFLARHPQPGRTEILAIIDLPTMTMSYPARTPTSLMPRSRFTVPVFPRREIGEPVLRFFKMTRRLRQTTSGLIEYRREPFLITCFPAVRLEKTFLLCLRPLSIIAGEIDRFKWRLIAFGALCLLFTSTLGFLLSQSFLQPIANLTQGIEAVRQKQFHHRVPLVAADELGNLSTVFNQMIEGLHEVSIGRLVQERLFPKKPLTAGTFAVSGVSRPASELGGDYFDYLPVGSDHLLVIVGDVTGHGIPAALIMAMAKAVIQTQSPDFDDPKPLLQQLNQVILTTMSKQYFMTMNLIWANHTTGDVVLYNCGHPYPIRLSAAGAAEMVPGSGLALGMRPQFRASPFPLRLEKGDRLVLYTDGLAEALTGDASVSGFDLFMEFIRSRPRLPLEAACLDILDQHPFVRQMAENPGTIPQPDDFTVVLIERREA